MGNSVVILGAQWGRSGSCCLMRWSASSTRSAPQAGCRRPG